MAPHEPQDDAYVDAPTLHDVALAVLRETVELARHSSDALAARTDAITNMSLAAETLVLSAPELGLSACRAVLTLQDGLNDVTDALGRVRALSDQAQDIAADVDDEDTVIELDRLVARVNMIADNAVTYGASMAAAYRSLDEDLSAVWAEIEPLVSLMNAINEVGADLNF
jgi:hypothetical protein